MFVTCFKILKEGRGDGRRMAQGWPRADGGGVSEGIRFALLSTPVSGRVRAVIAGMNKRTV